MITANVTAEFLKRLREPPDWSEIAFGFENHLISPAAVIDFAVDRVATTDIPLDDEVELAASLPNEPILDRLRKLSGVEVSKDDGTLRLRWANILLAWVYEHRNELSDPLGVVEEIYADLDYPHQLSQFVRYMPGAGPDLGSIERNEERMMASIGEYVHEQVLAVGA